MINWREIPYARAVIHLIVGILAAIYFKYPIPFGDAFLIGLLVCLILINRTRLDIKGIFTYSILKTITLFLLGYQLVFFHNPLQVENHFRSYLQKENSYIAIVDEMPISKKMTKLELRLEHIRVDDKWEPVSGRILAYISPDSISSSIQYGDQIQIHSAIQIIKAPSNPKQFDAQQFYHFQGIHYQSFIKKNKIHKYDINKGQLFYKLAYSIRNRFIRALEKHLSGDELAVGKALILGYKANLSDDIKEAYANTGAMHVLAVSGLHVGIISTALLWLFSFFPTPSRRSKIMLALIQISCIFGFALITGASPSVMRAATMFSFITFAKVTNSPASIYNILAASAFFLLLLNPFALMQVGFQLSYLAVLGIVYYHPMINKWLFFDNKILDNAWSLSAVAIGAQIGTLPISLYYFHQFPIYFLAAGLLVVPLAGVIMYTSLGLFFVDAFSSWIPVFGDIIGWFLNIFLWFMNSFIGGLQEMPFALLDGIWISSWSVLVLYLTIFFMTMSIQNRMLRWANFSFITGFIFLILNFSHSYYNQSKNGIVIYDIARNSLLEFYHAGQTKTLRSSQLTDKKIEFSAENYRTFRGASPSEALILENFESASSQIFFGNKSLLIVQESNPAEMIPSNFILIRNNPSLDLSPLLATVQPDKVIFDSSNSNKNVEKWIQSCKEEQIAYHVTQTSGAFVLEF